MAARNSYRTCRGGYQPPAGRWGHRPLRGAPKNYTAPVGADLRAARRPMAAARSGRWGHRPLRGAPKNYTAPVGADAHIRPSAVRPLRGRVDEDIDPYKFPPHL